MVNMFFYFVASLPGLEFYKKSVITYGEFLAESKRHLSARDFVVLSKATLGLDDLGLDHPTLSQWSDFNRRLRNEIVFFRAKKFSKDPVEFIRGDQYVPQDIVDSVAQALKALDPLQAEKVLDQLRWRKLDDLSSGHYFDLEWLMVYGLRLQILDRYQIVSSFRGKEIFMHYHQAEALESVQFSH
jgi:hypothetical protein